MAELLVRVPQDLGMFHEPFIGGGALFFNLQPRRAILSDLNLRLVRTYVAIRDQVEPVIERLSAYPHDKEFYLNLRASDIDAGTDVAMAAWMIYLNKTGFNGLYRVNRSGGFNVPFAGLGNPTICDAVNLRACSHALRNTQVVHGDFRDVVDRAEAGDFVYFDPPYVPVTPTSSFTSYTRNGFNAGDQRDLRDLALTLKLRSVSVLLSNSSVPLVHDLYADGFERIDVWANRAINCDASKRGKVAETLIW